MPLNQSKTETECPLDGTETNMQMFEATKVKERHAVDVPWTFAQPDAIVNNLVFFVLSGRPCFCCYCFKATGEGPVDSVYLHWMVIGPPDCTADIALLMVQSLYDSTGVVCESVREGVDIKGLRVHETYTIACQASSNGVIKKGSYLRQSNLPGEVLYMAWHCKPKDYNNIGVEDLFRFDENFRECSIGADQTEVLSWRHVQFILADNPEAAFRVEELVAKNLGMRDIRGKIDHTIAMLQTDINTYFSGLTG